MMFRIIAIVALLVFLFWSFNSLTKRYSFTRKQSRLIIVLGAALTTIMVLIVMGRLPIHFVLAPIGIALTLLLRLLPHLLNLTSLWKLLRGDRNTDSARGQRGSKVSVLRTEFLFLELAHESGDMNGRVIKGRLEGSQLSSLQLDQLLELSQECRSDNDSVMVLEAYLDRMHPGWRDRAGSGEKSTATGDEPVMNRALALEILGLAEGASADDVIKAHRKLMQRLHPDRGGTGYLAKKVNAAREHLLDEK